MIPSTYLQARRQGGFGGVTCNTSLKLEMIHSEMEQRPYGLALIHFNYTELNVDDVCKIFMQKHPKASLLFELFFFCINDIKSKGCGHLKWV